ncbi:MAG: CehA/McbA family metallohydrolase [Anaerolineales bacterium]
MHELVINLHMHTVYSDGTGTHADIARAALKCGLDVVVVTDHNVLVSGPQGYYGEGKKRVLMLVGEEVHDQTRNPQKSHLLVLGADRELATFAPDPQNLIDNARGAQGMSFLAHPFDRECKPIKETSISWDDWDVHGFTGLELWNGLSELKSYSPSIFRLLFYAFFPRLLARQPQAQTLRKWDELLSAGNKVVAIGGSDAHAFHKRMGPLAGTIFPYEFHFRTINTHILIPAALTGDVEADRRMVYGALAAGHAFIGYDLPAPTKGFRFSAQGREGDAINGDELCAEGGVTFKVRLPAISECHLLKDGEVIQKWKQHEVCSYVTTQPGVYRVEVYRSFLGRRRGWIFSNPIYVR